MRGVWTITRKDLRLRVRDRSVFLYGIVAPFVLAVVLGATFGGIEERIHLDLGVVADGTGQLAGSFVDEVLPVLQEDGLVQQLEVFDDVEAGRAAVERGELTAVVVFSSTGGTDPGRIEVLGNIDAPTGVGVTEAIVAGYAEAVRGVQLTVAAGMSAGATDPGALVAAAQDAARAVEVVDEPVGVEPIDLTTYMAAGMSVFFLLFSVGIAVTGLLEEQRDGTMARLVTSPIPAWAPLAAKALGAIIIGAVSMGMLVVATTVTIGADWGDPMGVTMLVVAAVLAATGLVGLVASFTRTPESASAALGVVGTVTGALGGSFFPLRDAEVLDVLSSMTPHHWFLQGLTRLAGGAAPTDVLDSVAVLLGLAAVTAAAAAVRLRRTEGV